MTHAEMQANENIMNAHEEKRLMERDKDPKRICINPDCEWEGRESETMIMKHGFPRYLCPECHEVTEEEDE